MKMMMINITLYDDYFDGKKHIFFFFGNEIYTDLNWTT